MSPIDAAAAKAEAHILEFLGEDFKVVGTDMDLLHDILSDAAFVAVQAWLDAAGPLYRIDLQRLPLRTDDDPISLVPTWFVEVFHDTD